MKSVSFMPNGLKYLVQVDELSAPKTEVEGYVIEGDKPIHDKATEGTIVAIGDGDRSRPLFCKYSLETKIAFGKFAGVEIELEEGKFLILAESEILGERIRTPFD